MLLVWCLTVERLSPGLSALYAAVYMLFILLTQKALKAIFRKTGEDVGACLRQGFDEMLEGMIAGSRNMIGIGVATAAAGIVVGTITLTGVGLVMAEFVEFISGGYVLLMLFFTAVLSLILGMGLPTTANYIVVSSLMAPVIVTVGAEHGLIVPLIAVHMFVFYFGILADDTPPVAMAGFAAAAISGRRPDQDRYPGLLLRHPHGNPSVPVHLQHGTADDRHRDLVPPAHNHCNGGDCHAALRRRDPGLFPDQEPLVGDPGNAAHRLPRCSGLASGWIRSIRLWRRFRPTTSSRLRGRCRLIPKYAFRWSAKAWKEIWLTRW